MLVYGVIALLQTAYPETNLDDIQGNDKIMGQYFTCVNHGHNVIRSHITGEPLLYNQEMANAEEEKEEDTTDEDGQADSGDDDASGSGSDDGEEDEEADSDIDDWSINDASLQQSIYTNTVSLQHADPDISCNKTNLHSLYLTSRSMTIPVTMVSIHSII